MALIGNETFALESQWAEQAISSLNMYPDFFSKAKMREARVKLIAGTNMLTSIKHWLESAQIALPRARSEYLLTDFGKRILENDFSFSKSTTWWAVHLSICFSTRGEPYTGFFSSLDVFSKELKGFDDIIIELADQSDYAEKSISTNLSGVKAMFAIGGPMADLHLIQIKNSPNGKSEIGLGDPKIPDEVIVFALALARHHKFASRVSVDFAELEKIGLTNFLCLPPTKLRERLKEIEQSQRWKDSFSFTQNANLDSISFMSSFSKDKCLISLLQSGKNTWI